MSKQDFAPQFRKLIDDNPDLFVSCDADGAPNSKGAFWRTFFPDEKPPQPKQK